MHMFLIFVDGGECIIEGLVQFISNLRILLIFLFEKLGDDLWWTGSTFSISGV